MCTVWSSIRAVAPVMCTVWVGGRPAAALTLTVALSARRVPLHLTWESMAGIPLLLIVATEEVLEVHETEVST